MPGLSKDPAKRRRQLEALARGSEKRAATLRAQLEALDQPEPEAPASAAASGAASGATGRVQAGRYSEAASAAPSEAAEPEPAAPHEAALEEDEPDLEPEPSRGLSLAARLLGVDK